MSSEIKIVIVDDHPVVVNGLKSMLEGERIFSVSATFTGQEGLLNYIKNTQPDIVLLDIMLRDANGMDLCLDLKKTPGKTAIIMFSNSCERSLILQCLENGASGYLLKNASFEELREAILDTVSGKIVFSQEIRDILKNSGDTTVKTPRITKREKEILEYLKKGLTSQQIADILFLSPLTVDTHRKNLLQKCNAKNTAELIQICNS